MRSPIPPAPRRHQKDAVPPFRLAVFVLAGCLAGLGTAVWRERKGEPPCAGGDVPAGDFEVQRVQLLDKIHEWDRRAIAAGLEPILPLPGSGGCAPARAELMSDSGAISCPDDIPPGTTPQGTVSPGLEALIKRVAINNEVMLALANGVMICKNTTICWWGGGNILHSWLDNLREVGVTNVVVGVLDDETERYLIANFPSVAYFRPAGLVTPGAQEGSHPANRVSTLKYALVKQFLQMRYSVLVSDMDLLYLDNPFKHLHRDADIEGQTDGFTEQWSYGSLDGISDPTMGWGGGGLFFKAFTLNVGCAFIRPNRRTVQLMDNVFGRLSSAQGWDQQIFNEELLFLSHGNKKSPMCSVRIMDINLFTNSKIFFRTARQKYLPGARARPDSRPVMVHMNYHPDKHKRMLCLIDRYFKGRVDACDRLPGGSEPGT